MTTALIIIAIIGILTGMFLISNRIGVNRTIMEHREISEAHEKLGYPELDRETQFNIMETGNLKPIAALIPEFTDKGIPLKLLRHYIKISEEEFKEYLSKSGFLGRQKIENASNPEHDGVWIKGNQIIDQERGQTHRTWNILTKEDAINVYSDLLWEKMNFE